MGCHTPTPQGLVDSQFAEVKLAEDTRPFGAVPAPVISATIVVGACPLGEEEAETKAQIIKAVRSSLDGVINLDQSRRPIQIGENKVRQIIDWLAERCYLGVLPGSNPNHNRYYKHVPVDLMEEFYPRPRA